MYRLINAKNPPEVESTPDVPRRISIASTKRFRFAGGPIGKWIVRQDDANAKNPPEVESTPDVPRRISIASTKRLRFAGGPIGKWIVRQDDAVGESIPVHRTTEDDLYTEIDDILQRAGKEDWDGEGAVAITQQTADTARYLADFFLSSNINPDVSESPYGEIDFDFQLSKNESFTISAFREEVVFSATFREVQKYGRAHILLHDLLDNVDAAKRHWGTGGWVAAYAE